jgi:DNA mismatch endonuclease, patch repair protein
MMFRTWKKAIFVHGCFWHQHQDPKCLDGRAPKSNLDYWAPKLARNVTRDANNLEALKAIGWKTLVIWECEVLRTPDRMAKKVASFLR